MMLPDDVPALWTVCLSPPGARRFGDGSFHGVVRDDDGEWLGEIIVLERAAEPWALTLRHVRRGRVERERRR